MHPVDSKLAPHAESGSPQVTDSTTSDRRLFGVFDAFDGLLLFLFVATYAVVANLPFAPKKFGDMDFHVEAQAFAAFLKGVGRFQDLALTRAPAPSLYYTVPYLFVPTGSDENVYWQFAFVWTTCWMALSLLLIRRAGQILGGPLAGKIAGLLVLASPFSVYYSYAITAEPVAYVSVSLFLYGWARWQDGTAAPGARKWASRLAYLGIAFFLLSRPNAALLLPVAGLVAILFWRKGPGSHRPRAQFAARCVLSGAVALLFMNLAGHALVGRVGNLRQGDYLRYIVFQGRFQLRDEPNDWRFFAEVTRPDSRDWQNFKRRFWEYRMAAERDGLAVGKMYEDFAIADLKAHPLMAVRQIFERTAFGHVALVNSIEPKSFRIGPLRGLSGYLLVHFVINASSLLLLFASAVALWRRRQGLLELWPLWGTYLSLLMFHAFVYMEPRYLFPARVVVAMIGSSVLVGPVQSVLRRFRRTTS